MSADSFPRPVLVTGSHRSGTTWVGRTLASHPDVVFLDEPLNLHEGGPSEVFFQSVTKENEKRVADYVCSQLLGAKPHRALIKDPMALMSAEWLAARFGAHVVVMIRHPAAFASSVKILDWPHPWEHFLSQHELMATRLREFAVEIQALATSAHDVIDDARLLWRICHRVIRQYQSEHPGWMFVRHEDLSRDPINGFASIFEAVSLGFDPRCQEYIRTNSLAPAAGVDVTRAGGTYEIRRNSAANLWHWRDRLSGDELRRIRVGLDDFEHFYPEAEWAF